MIPCPNNKHTDPAIPLLMHCCCGPCAAGSIAPVLDDGRRITLLFSNSNLDTEAEYLRRLDALKTLADYYGLRVETDPWDHAAWLEFSSHAHPFLRNASARTSRPRSRSGRGKIPA